jgi:hypothetical protein
MLETAQPLLRTPARVPRRKAVSEGQTRRAQQQGIRARIAQKPELAEIAAYSMARWVRIAGSCSQGAGQCMRGGWALAPLSTLIS